MTMAVENRAAGRMLGMLLGPLSGSSLQQKRSFLDGQLGKAIGSPVLDVRDEPLLPRGLASRTFDGEGLSTKPRAIFEKGTLATYFIDTYYGRKLGRAPTTAAASNVVMSPGDKSLAELLAAMKEGVLVTGFLGGNSNGATGDYSLGIAGYRVRGGQLAEPIGEMNIGGNQADLWKRLVARGNDPWAYSRMRLPTLVFEGVQIAGT
jgi:PmbA protein